VSDTRPDLSARDREPDDDADENREDPSCIDASGRWLNGSTLRLRRLPLHGADVPIWRGLDTVGGIRRVVPPRSLSDLFALTTASARCCN
jgi:hypothetical protein